MRNPASQSRRTVVAVLIAMLAILAGLVGGLTGWLRSRLHAEVLQREAEAMHAVALMQVAAVQAREAGASAGDGEAALFTAVLESSRLRGVLAVDLRDEQGALRLALPEPAADQGQKPWWPANPDQPLVRYQAHGSLEAVFGAKLAPGDEPTRAPLLEIVVPLRAGAAAGIRLGVAHYWIDGGTVAAEFARMDQGLLGLAVLAFLGGAALVTGVLVWALRRLGAAELRLAEQGQDLARANQELDFAAKTGAIGAISAHLIHGLKNPLAGLEGFVSDPASAQAGPQGEAWRGAVETTRRLRALVQEVTVVLRAEAAGRAEYPVPAAEWLGAAAERLRNRARPAGVEVEFGPAPTATVTGRTANLGGLILDNLVGNAVEATPPGGRVRVTATATNETLDLLVEDTGPGLSDEARAALFRPVRSTKRHGGGVGLAISHQLARHLGGALELVHSGPAGSAFRLRVPRLPP
ncbi:MAG: HAMP domain-containing histidine kinase [Verrucomicrobia bacterium]|nr:HAMP domain-containing histidine kinase [Verrucomicrobiota bacterium]